MRRRIPFLGGGPGQPGVARALAGLVCLALVAAGPARAQEPKPVEPRPAAPPVIEPKNDDEYLTEVHADAVSEARPADDPAGFSTVIALQNVTPGTRMGDLLDRVPGARTRDLGVGARQTLSLRGSDSQQVAVFLDGFRLTPSSGGGVDLSLLDPVHLEQVEVRRGGGSARFGSDALGGVLLLRTPRLRTRPRSQAAVSYGSYNTVAARLSRSAAWGDLRYLASGSFRRTDGDFPYLEPENQLALVRSNNDSQQGEALLKADWLAASRVRLQVLSDLSVSERGAPGPSDDKMLNSETARQLDLRHLAGLQLTVTDLPRPGARLDATLSHRTLLFRYNRDQEGPYVPETHVETHEFTPAFNLRLSLPVNAAFALDSGAELRGAILRDPASDDPFRVEGDLWAASRLTLADGHLLLVPALRLDGASGFDPTLIPKVGLVLRPFQTLAHPWIRGLEAAANLGRSFRYPTFQELYVRIDHYSGNEALRPEDSLDVDLGLRWDAPLLRLEAAYFRREIENTILFAPVSSFLIRADNYSAAMAHGLEAAFTLSPGLGLTLREAYTYMRTAFGDPPTLELPGRPRHRLVSRLGFAFPFVPGDRRSFSLSLSAELAYESDMPLDRFNNIRGRERLMLSASASAGYRWFTLTLEGQNLLDQRDAVDTLNYPLPPARFLLTLAAAL